MIIEIEVRLLACSIGLLFAIIYHLKIIADEKAKSLEKMNNFYMTRHA